MKKRRTIRWLIAIMAALLVVVIGLYIDGRRPVPDASADSLTSAEWELRPVFEGVSLSQPVWMEQPPGNPDRWYAVEQRGRLVTFPNDPDHKGKKLALDITDRVKFGGEQGLLGLAFHPNYADNGYIYVNYTSTEDGSRMTRVSRFERSSNGISFERDSEKVLLRVAQPYANHNGGQVSFGPDGYLYIGYGDGGLAGDPKEHGQNTSTLLGTIARIDVDGGDPYSVPADNPFADGGGAPEAYAWGLRNPWRFSWDRKTKKLWAGDVGQNAWEEIDIIEKGKNYGWNIREGKHCYKPPLHLKPLGSGDCGRDDVDLTDPVLDYPHSEGQSVTGGYVYRGTQQQKLIGKYVYGDFVSGRIWAYDPATKKNAQLLDTGVAIPSFIEAADGEIGVFDYGSGKIYHLAEKGR